MRLSTFVCKRHDNWYKFELIMNYPFDPTEKMFRFLTGKGSNERTRKEKAIKFPVKVRTYRTTTKACKEASRARTLSWPLLDLGCVKKWRQRLSSTLWWCSSLLNFFTHFQISLILVMLLFFLPSANVRSSMWGLSRYHYLDSEWFSFCYIESGLLRAGSTSWDL